MFVLDTNVISELRKKNNADRRVIEWASKLPSSTLFLSAISIMEAEVGALLAERRDPPLAAQLRAWIDDHVLRHFAERILPIDTDVSLQCAKLHVPKTRAYRDTFIAATAFVHDMTVVTRNTKDFEATGVRLLNPWLPQP